MMPGPGPPKWHLEGIPKAPFPIVIYRETMKHLRGFKELFESSQELTQEQKDWLDECTIGDWELNPQTGLIDVDGTFDCNEQGLTDLKGVRFGKVREYFDCSENQLTSLEGAPQEVGGDFYCQQNSLTSLVGAPQSVGGSFYCYGNQLTTLKGAPQSVGGSFDCSGNQLTSLVGAPQMVGGTFYCEDNQLTSLKGAPQRVGRDLDCQDNELTSLEGAPQSVGGDLALKGNPVSSGTLESIFKLMLKGKSYQQALGEYWPKMGEEDKILMYKDNSALSQEEIRMYKALSTYNNIKGYL